MLLSVLAALGTAFGQSGEAGKSTPIPVIFDTDIGDDIDDTWALGFLLRCPELDLKLAVGDNGKPEYRAKLLARFLERAGRGDVPVGIGLDVNPKEERATSRLDQGLRPQSVSGQSPRRRRASDHRHDHEVPAPGDNHRRRAGAKHRRSIETRAGDC